MFSHVRILCRLRTGLFLRRSCRFGTRCRGFGEHGQRAYEKRVVLFSRSAKVVKVDRQIPEFKLSFPLLHSDLSLLQNVNGRRTTSNQRTEFNVKTCTPGKIDKIANYFLTTKIPLRFVHNLT